MQTRFCVRRGHSAAVFTSGRLSTSDHDVVDPGHFTSESAQILIGEIMGCNRDLENILKNINDVQQKMKNIIDVLGRV
ncbi:hypothetical protein AB205_0159900 [Aquarana catesbeiana]|uniref:Uncharacterized protein n=1 Tax=Aquarana catesbeiana TaxID=8400 RepID=A0A2G9QBV5_AQUCT|nr:hypothetical protein AB205_0159900 [Aquarana catesbeiana]